MHKPEFLPFQALVLATMSEADRARGQAAFRLDRECAQIARMAKDPLMAQIRLSWWRDGIGAAELSATHRTPDMEALRGAPGFEGARSGLSAIVDGWEELILADGEQEWIDMLPRYAQGRGEGLFAALGGGSEETHAGRVWALWDLGGNVSDEKFRAPVLAAGAAACGQVDRGRIASLPHPLKMLALPAMADIARGRGAPSDMNVSLYFRLLRIQLFGR
jgi:phytoene synthase